MNFIFCLAKRNVGFHAILEVLMIGNLHGKFGAKILISCRTNILSFFLSITFISGTGTPYFAIALTGSFSDRNGGRGLPLMVQFM